MTSVASATSRSEPCRADGSSALPDGTDRCSTLPGYILWQLGHLPEAGATVTDGTFVFEVVSMDGRNIGKVPIRQSQER
ncbi:MAG: transporter associated domain-containing protein [Pseudomonadota bacterium]